MYINHGTIRQTSREYFRSLQMVYIALIAGQVFFGVVSFYLNQFADFGAPGKELRDIFIYIVPLFIIGGTAASLLVFKNRLKVSAGKTSLNEKMTDYRAALIVRYALLEGPSFLALVVYLLTGDLLFLGMAGLIVLFFLTIMPTINKGVKDLELSPADEQLLNDPNAVITGS